MYGSESDPADDPTRNVRLHEPYEEPPDWLLAALHGQFDSLDEKTNTRLSTGAFCGVKCSSTYTEMEVHKTTPEESQLPICREFPNQDFPRLGVTLEAVPTRSSIVLWGLC